ncbi:hypothetical protein AAIH18_22360, partial [Pantoea agglomerans]|uniref:hypothetical protein n=1 Tax=Enterobacter agglomerans TaxID=549 RepID=UPI003D29EF8B
MTIEDLAEEDRRLRIHNPAHDRRSDSVVGLGDILNRILESVFRGGARLNVGVEHVGKQGPRVVSDVAGSPD